MESLHSQLVTIECAATKYGMIQELKTINDLMKRLALYFDTDQTLEIECESFIASQKSTMERFNRETL